MAVTEALFPERSKSASDGSKRACRGLSAHSWPAGLPHPRFPVRGCWVPVSPAPKSYISGLQPVPGQPGSQMRVS